MATKSSKCATSLNKVQDAVNAADEVSLATFGLDTETLMAMLNNMDSPKKANSFFLKTAFLKAEGIAFEFAMGEMLSGIGSHVLNMSTNGFNYGMKWADSSLSVVSATAFGDKLRSKTAQRLYLNQITDLGRTLGDFGKLINPFNGTKGWKSLEDLPLDLWHHPDFVTGAQQASVRTGYTPDPKMRRGAAGELAEEVKNTSRGEKRHISATNMGISNKNPIGKGVGFGVDMAGAIVNSFGNAMRHEDIAAKTLQFRLKLRQLSRERAEKIVRGKMEHEGISEDEALDQMEIYAAKVFEFPDEDMLAMAAKSADDDTFTGTLGDLAGPTRAFLQKPGLRLLTPFFKTLANLTNYGVRQSPIGELGRMLHIYKGEDYWTKLVEKSARGDAARSQAAISALMVYGTYEYLGVDPFVDGHGFTGHIDMSNAVQRQRALTVAPAFSWKFKDGDIWEFKDYPQLQTMMGFYSGAREMATKIQEGREYYDPETGAIIEDPAMFIWDISTTIPEHMFGNHFAMESFSKINAIFETLLTGDEGAKGQASAMLKDLATMWAIPAGVKDVNAVGARVEQFMNIEDSKKFFNDEMQQAHSMLQRVDNAWFGGENAGVERDMHGNEMQSKHNLTRQVQSHKLSNWPEKPDEVDFKLFSMDQVKLLDNPEVIHLTGLGTTVKLTGMQTDALMLMLGKGGDLPFAGKVDSQREFLSKILFHPQITRRPKHIQEGMIQQLIRQRESAFKLLFVKLNPDLEEQAKQNLVRKQQLLTGELSINTKDYFPDLFEYIGNIDLMMQNLLSNNPAGN